jgi:hypothetical protein
MTDRADRLAVIGAICLAALAVLAGVRMGYRELDVDEVVYRDTIMAVRDGQGYYPAMREALVAKEGAPPSQIRSVRPPTLYVFLSWFPPAAWRYLVGVVYLATLLLAWRLARPLHSIGGPLAVFLTGMWMVAASPLFFLNTELWGLPFMLAGALALRNQRWALAAVALSAAAVLREIFVLPLLVGFAVSPRRRPWIVALAVVLGLALLHADLAREILSAEGKEAPFGKSGLGPRYLLSALSPSAQPGGWLVGVTGTILGLLGLRLRWAEDPAARLLLPFVAVMIPLTWFLGRVYWGLAFGPALACFAPAGLHTVSSYLASTGAKKRPV